MKDNLLFITNIPSPYRIDMFNYMESVKNELGFDFKVNFMRVTEDDRKWPIDQSTYRFKYYIDKGIYFYLPKYTFHFHLNFNLVKIVLQEKSPKIILAGSWNYATVMILLLMKRFKLIKNEVYFWAEANYMYSLSNCSIFSKIIFYIRKYLLESIDKKLIVNGKIAKDTFNYHWMIKRDCIYLPNLINSAKYRADPAMIRRKTFENGIISIFISARLEESTKGLLNYISKIKDGKWQRMRIYIAGEGPDRGKLEKYIQDKKLEKSIILLGNQSQKEMISNYKKYNIFLLPSIREAGGMSIIEAAFSAMPLLISKRCGNLNEVLEEGVNGYSFDPYDEASINESLDTILSKDIFQLNEMGIKSLEIAGRNFDNYNGIKCFIEGMRV